MEWGYFACGVVFGGGVVGAWYSSRTFMYLRTCRAVMRRMQTVLNSYSEAFDSANRLIRAANTPSENQHEVIICLEEYNHKVESLTAVLQREIQRNEAGQ